MKLQELLKTWSELEPGRCRALSRIESYTVKINNLEHDLFFPENAQRIKDDCIALAFKSAMEAIEQNDLLLKLENDGQKWRSALIDLKLEAPNEKLPIAPRFLAAEPTHELTAIHSYVLWLQYKRDEAAKVETEEQKEEPAV